MGRSGRRRQTLATALVVIAAAAAAALAAYSPSAAALRALYKSVLGGGGVAFSRWVDGSGVVEQLAIADRLSDVKSDPVSQSWSLCAVEGGSCRCTGSVAMHTWMGEWAMLRHVNGSIRCSPDSFGGDPRVGLA